MHKERETSLFEIDAELDELLDAIQEATEADTVIDDAILARFHVFCQAHGEKVDRIGRFIRMMEARETYCRGEAARLSERARAASGKVERTKAMVMFHLMSRNTTRIEGREFTLRVQKNSQDTVKVTSEQELPIGFQKLILNLDGVLFETVLANLPQELAAMVQSAVCESRPDNKAIKAAIHRNEEVAGAELRRGVHLRIA